MRHAFPAAVLFLTACRMAGFAQTQAGFLAPAPTLAEPVVNQPYSADLVAETVQILADGSTATRTIPNLRLYRDSAGRTRTDGPILLNPESGVETVVMVVIVDPVAGFQYVLDPRRRVAHRRPLEAPAPSPAATAQAPARPRLTSEPMGSQWLEGVSVQGVRLTLAHPAPSQTEYWMSPDLQVMVLQRRIDPQGGEASNRLTHIVRAEPDVTLFAPPADYTAVDETSDIRILP